jgi:hypothetical protein
MRLCSITPVIAADKKLLRTDLTVYFYVDNFLQNTDLGHFFNQESSKIDCTYQNL